jgi:hypothetical protein
LKVEDLADRERLATRSQEIVERLRQAHNIVPWREPEIHEDPEVDDFFVAHWTSRVSGTSVTTRITRQLLGGYDYRELLRVYLRFRSLGDFVVVDNHDVAVVHLFSFDGNT